VTDEGIAVVVAVQEASRAKSRLGAALDAATRRELVIAMLDDVLSAIRAAHAGPLIVVSADEGYDGVATGRGAEILRDAGAGYNEAVILALHALAARRSAAAALVLPGDVPQLKAADVGTLIATLAQPGAVLVRSADGGTTALGLHPVDAFRPAFGPESGQRHREAAHAAGVRLTELRLNSLRLDVDTLEDLADIRDDAGSATRAVIADLMLPASQGRA